jgi:hypothetical protein
MKKQKRKARRRSVGDRVRGGASRVIGRYGDMARVVGDAPFMPTEARAVFRGSSSWNKRLARAVKKNPAPILIVGIVMVALAAGTAVWIARRQLFSASKG